MNNLSNPLFLAWARNLPQKSGDPSAVNATVGGWSAKPSGGGTYVQPRVREMQFTPAPAPKPAPQPAPRPQPVQQAPAPRPTPPPAANKTPRQLEKPYDPGNYAPNKNNWTPEDGAGDTGGGTSYLDDFLEKNKKYFDRPERDATVETKPGDVTGDPEKEKSPKKIMNDWGLGSLMDPFKRKRERQSRMAGSGDFLSALQSTTQTSFNSSFG
jgi:hypothetical protein